MASDGNGSSGAKKSGWSGIKNALLARLRSTALPDQPELENALNNRSSFQSDHDSLSQSKDEKITLPLWQDVHVKPVDVKIQSNSMLEEQFTKPTTDMDQYPQKNSLSESLTYSQTPSKPVSTEFEVFAESEGEIKCERVRVSSDGLSAKSLKNIPGQVVKYRDSDFDLTNPRLFLPPVSISDERTQPSQATSLSSSQLKEATPTSTKKTAGISTKQKQKPTRKKSFSRSLSISRQ